MVWDPCRDTILVWEAWEAGEVWVPGHSKRIKEEPNLISLATAAMLCSPDELCLKMSRSLEYENLGYTIEVPSIGKI